MSLALEFEASLSSVLAGANRSGNVSELETASAGPLTLADAAVWKF